MKILRFALSAACVLVAIIMVSHRSVAQPTNAAPNTDILDKQDQLIMSLSQRGDSNTVKQVTELLSDIYAQRFIREVAFNIRVLNELRSGKTNAAINLLETGVDSGLMNFGYPEESDHSQKYSRF